MATLIMDEALYDIFLVCAHDDAVAHVRVIRLGPKVPLVGRVPAVFQ